MTRDHEALMGLARTAANLTAQLIAEATRLHVAVPANIYAAERALDRWAAFLERSYR